RGIIEARHLWNWWALIAGADQANINGGWAPSNRCDVSIALLRPGSGSGASAPAVFSARASASASAGAGGFGASASSSANASASAGGGAGGAGGRQVALGWRLENAMPIKFRVGDLNARGSTDVAIEELHLAHEGLHMSGVV